MLLPNTYIRLIPGPKKISSPNPLPGPYQNHPLPGFYSEHLLIDLEHPQAGKGSPSPYGSCYDLSFIRHLLDLFPVNPIH